MTDKPAKSETTTEATRDEPAWKGSLSATEPQIGPDGHVHLSQEDIDARDA